MRMKPRSLALLVLAALLLVLAVVATAASATILAPNRMGAKAYAYIDQLTRVPNADGSYTKILRLAGTPDELSAAQKVQGWLSDAGYDPELKAFSYLRRGVTYGSQNVVAFHPADLKRHGKSRPLVIVGAHYDASSAGAGADDNASGVGVMFEVAERLDHFKIDYDVAFVAFGAEEVGLEGSSAFAGQMSPADVSRTVAMINFDSPIFGDKLYIHAGANEKTWARDAMLRLIRLRAYTTLVFEFLKHLNP